MSTNRDYADMVNPHVRAEQEAHAKGYWQGMREAAMAVAAGVLLADIAMRYFL